MDIDEGLLPPLISILNKSDNEPLMSHSTVHIAIRI